MPRRLRLQSGTDIYHVMMRGNNKQQIFLDDQDCRKFLWILDEERGKQEFEILAYCLMGNHVHLLLRCNKPNLVTAMKVLQIRFVIWYNRKYDRSGHLFQDRFRSEPVETESYLYTAFRYILNNPVKAGMCAKAEDYFYSSTWDYLRGSGFTDVSFLLGLIGGDHILDFLNKENDDICLDLPPEKMTDQALIEFICEVADVKSPEEYQSFSKEKLADAISILRQNGISIRQIHRFTGVSMRQIKKY